MDNSVIRILQEDVWKEENNWEDKLRENLHSFETSTIIYLYEGEEKEIHLGNI